MTEKPTNKAKNYKTAFSRVLMLLGFGLLALALFHVVFYSEKSIYRYIMLNRDINILKEERDNLKRTIDETNDELASFQKEKNQLEKLAREKYYMRKANEDVFIIKDATNHDE
ncbi:MAG: septum formation initiator family protein [Paludibacteraceae bacterium]|nr:septum formation initiator family protein [Paludibacteraceae bacterium]